VVRLNSELKNEFEVAHKAQEQAVKDYHEAPLKEANEKEKKKKLAAIKAPTDFSTDEDKAAEKAARQDDATRRREQRAADKKKKVFDREQIKIQMQTKKMRKVNLASIRADHAHQLSNGRTLEDLLRKDNPKPAIGR
jgi:hypothetical protein